MPNSDSYRPARPRIDEDDPTVVDPALGMHVADGVDSRLGEPVAADDEKTVISNRPPVGTGWAGGATANELGALLQGRQLGHFTLEKFVGGGGMGAVFRGRDTLLGRIVAVKVLSRDQGSDLETLRRFKNEAQSAARLDHDNIARVFFVGEHEGWNYIVFEFIEGVNVRDLVERDGPLSLELAIDFTIQIAEALAHAAEREVVHRDIKPSNILVTPDHRAKLVDMGLARLHQMEAGESDLTASGVTLGTFDYISPEQASDPRRADVRSDMYSLGCTLFYMLTGRPPFPQGTVLQKLLAHSGEAAPDPRADRPELPEGISKVVLRLMAKRPDQRYREPAELIGDLLMLRERLGLARYGADGPWVTENLSMPWRDRAIAWGAPVAVLALLFVALNAYWAGGDSRVEALPEYRRPASQINPIVTPLETPVISPLEEALGPVGEAIGPSPQNSPRSPRPLSPPLTPDADDSVDPDDAVVAPRETRTPAAATETTVTPRGLTVPSPTGNSGAAQDSSSSTGREAPTSRNPTVSAPLRLVVIGDASRLGDLGETVAVFPSLAKALADPDVIAQIANLQAVEIRAPLVVETSPVMLALPKDAELTIRGTPGASGELPIVRFEQGEAPTAADSAVAFGVAGGKLTFDNLHLQLRSAKLARSAYASLVRLEADAATDLQFSRCVVTIDDAGVDNPPPTAVVDVAPTSDDAERSVVPVSFRNTIVRGRASLLRMRQSQGLDLLWNNGLFVSNQPLLLAEGNNFDDAEPNSETIRLRLDKVTVSTASGLCLLRDSVERPQQPDLEFVSNRCIIAADGSLVEHDGMHDLEDYEKSLRVAGSNNFYEDTRVFWRVYVDNVEQQKWDWAKWRDYLLMERGGMSLFYAEVRWNRPRSEVQAVAIQDRGIDDYTLDPIASKKAMNDDAGFDAKLLPPLYRLPIQEKSPASSAIETSIAPALPAP